MDSDAPSIRSARPGRPHEVIVTWKGGSESPIDLADFIRTYAVFAPLRKDDAAFRALEVGDWGWSIRWSDDMDVASSTLKRLALEQGAAWLRDWRLRHDLTQEAAAAALGISHRMWRYYEAGTHLLPKTVRLACLGVDAELRAA